MIGNNSAGSFSLKHRTTREHTESIRAVLSDGSLVTFGPLTNEELEAKCRLQSLEGRIYKGMTELLRKHKDAIFAAYPHPEITRRNTGYALDRLCEMEPFTAGGRPFNMAELLCGSEGTLAMTVDAVVRLVPVPKHKILLIGQYASLRESMLATVEAVKHGTAAVELIDDIIIKATERNIEQTRNRFFIVGDPKAVLIIQFEGDDAAELIQRAEALTRTLAATGLGYDYKVITEFGDMDRVWELRKAGLGLLMGTWAESRTPEFIEDTSVRVEDLPAYIEEFQALMASYGTHSVYYAHASVGELHLRPELNLTTRDGLEKMKSMAVDVARLVKKYRGSLSGEHGDGRVRAPYISYVLGEEMMPLLRDVKRLWDPDGIFNPGKIVDAKPMDADLRFYPEDRVPEIDTVFRYRAEGNFMALVDKCNGAGACRKLAGSGGTMCPSYMATREESDTTRGRANLFRQIFRGEHKDAFASEDLHKGLGLCLSCKACKTECPAGVDMAKMKAEFTQGRHDAVGAPLSYHFFARPELLYPFAAPFARFVNWLNRLHPVKEVYKTLFNIHPERDLPDFASETFEQWFNKREKQQIFVPDAPAVLIMVDLFMNYNEPAIGRAMTETLETLGYKVIITRPLQSGRTHLSKGFVRDARSIAEKNIALLHPYASKGISVVGQEPSEILTLRDEYVDLCGEELLAAAHEVAANSFLFEEFILKHLQQHPEDLKKFNGRNQPVLVHGHCHAKALVGVKPVMDVLEKIGYLPEDLKTGCCGMAGSFGYETEHYEISQQIGELVLFPKVRAAEAETLICAHGFSCRHQISDGPGNVALHTAILINNALFYK
jgi:Fe-S oxidoreductase/FAD/FMN-containing dehydrogenase